MIAPDGLPWGRLKQPDRLSCGAAVLVVARMLSDEVYAGRVLPRFAEEVLATHRQVVGWGPRALGTPPARGGLVTVDAEQAAQDRLPFGRWHRAWFALLPRATPGDAPGATPRTR